MPISIPDLRPLEVTRLDANSFKILGFEVRTDTDHPGDDRAFIRKEARRVVDSVVVERVPLRVTEYTGTTMLPVLADIGRRFCALVGVAAPAGEDTAIGYQLYVAFRDGLYAAERQSGEFPVDAR